MANGRTMESRLKELPQVVPFDDIILNRGPAQAFAARCAVKKSGRSTEESVESIPGQTGLLSVPLRLQHAEDAFGARYPSQSGRSRECFGSVVPQPPLAASGRV